VHQLRRLLCGVRYGALNRVSARRRSIGLDLVNDVRDAGTRGLRCRADGGCHACHSHQSCQEHCPRAQSEASIAGLKGHRAGYLRGEIKHERRL